MKRLLILLLPAVGIGLLTAPLAADPVGHGRPLDREIVHGETGSHLDELVSRYSEWGFAGTVLVAEGDEVLLHKGYGLADRELGRPHSVATRHRFLSVTKPILASAVLRLVERGVLDLDAPLSSYLGRFPESKQGATLHHLLTHTAGLAVRGSDVGRPRRAEFIQAMKGAPIESPPGEQHRYSNAGYSLIAAVVEEATGKPWETVVREEVFGPAAMVDSALATDPDAPSTAIGYAGAVHAPRAMTLADGPPAMAELWWGAAGAAGVDGTVADLYRWLRAVTTGGLFSGESAAKMFTAYVGDQGYGWHVDTTDDGAPRRWKGGGLPMYESQVAWYPDRELVIVFAINNHFGWRVPLWSAVEKILFGGAVEPPPRPDPSAPLGVVGSHRLGDGGVVRIEIAGDWVVLTAEDEAAARALGFEDSAAAPGATLAAKVVAPGILAGLHLRPGHPDLRWVEIRITDSAGRGALKTGATGKRAGVAEKDQVAVRAHAEHPDGATAGVQRVQMAPVGHEAHLERSLGQSAGRDIAGEETLGPCDPDDTSILPESKSLNVRAGAGVEHVQQVAVLSQADRKAPTAPDDRREPDRAFADAEA